MKRKLLVLLTVTALVFSALGIVSFADGTGEHVVFYNADTNTPVNYIGEAKNVYARVWLSGGNSENKYVIIAGYDEDGKKTVSAKSDDFLAAEGNTYGQSETLSTDGVSKIKVFVWTKAALIPVLSRTGALEKTYNENNFDDKITVKETAPVTVGTSLTVCDLFDSANVNSETFEITGEGFEFAADTTDWKKGTLTFNNVGEITLTAQDYSFCKPAVATVEVKKLVRYTKVFENTDTYLYRVGNQNTVALSSLFKTDVTEPASTNLQVLVAPVQGEGVRGEFNSSDNTIKFSGTGVVKVTISDDYSEPCELLLEVIDAKNITKAEGATANDVVLLNDISGTFTVSNGHTFHGNGFTVTLPTTHVKNKGHGFTGYISIGAAQDSGVANGGNLDNVKIIGPVYPEANIYRKQAEITDKNDPDYGDGANMRYFVNSVIVYGGNCTISNSYISGSRTALCLRGGNNVVIENTTLSGGAYANMQIGSGSSVTLRDLTTIQKDEEDSYGKGKKAHGLGVAVDSNIVDLYIEGELNQYNWICEEQWDKIVPSTYQSSFPDFFGGDKYKSFWHYLNGGSISYINMAFVYACNWDKTKIHDNREIVDYITCDSTFNGISGGAYSKSNTVGGNAISDSDLTGTEYKSTGFNPVAPVFTFDNSLNNDDDDENDSMDTYCVYNESAGTLKIGVSGDSKTIDLSKVTVNKNGTALEYTAYLNGTQISGNSVTVKTADGAKQTLTFKATDNQAGYDKDGNPIEGSIEYIWNITVEIAVLAYPAPVWNMNNNYTFDATGVHVSYGPSYDLDYAEAVPIYEGIKINYYDKSGKLVNRDLSGTTTHPTGSNNSNSNPFTYTLTDGASLSMKYVSGWTNSAITHQFTTYDNKVYIYPQSLDTTGYVTNNKEEFNVIINYVFTDPNGQSISQNMKWIGNPSTEVKWHTFDTVNGKEYGGGCVTGDTLVTLADGSYKRIDEITASDMLMVWDFYKGEYTAVPSAIIFNKYDYADNTVIKLIFEDGTEVKAVNLHQFFNSEENKFVTIDENSVKDYVGKGFIKRAGNGYKNVKLADYEISKEYVKPYGIISAVHYNILVQDMFSADFMREDYDLFNYFEVGDNMKYDKDKMLSDIEKYGLYSFEDFKEYLTPEQFEAFNVKYMNVAVGKGNYTYEGILSLIEKYLK